MNHLVEQFYNQKEVREAVRNYFNHVMDQKIIELVRRNEDVTNYGKAITLVNKVFSSMQKDFHKKESKSVVNQNK